MTDPRLILDLLAFEALRRHGRPITAADLIETITQVAYNENLSTDPEVRPVLRDLEARDVATRLAFLEREGLVTRGSSVRDVRHGRDVPTWLVAKSMTNVDGIQALRAYRRVDRVASRHYLVQFQRQIATPGASQAVDQLPTSLDDLRDDIKTLTDHVVSLARAMETARTYEHAPARDVLASKPQGISAVAVDSPSASAREAS